MSLKPVSWPTTPTRTRVPMRRRLGSRDPRRSSGSCWLVEKGVWRLRLDEGGRATLPELCVSTGYARFLSDRNRPTDPSDFSPDFRNRTDRPPGPDFYRSIPYCSGTLCRSRQQTFRYVLPRSSPPPAVAPVRAATLTMAQGSCLRPQSSLLLNDSRETVP